LPFDELEEIKLSTLFDDQNIIVIYMSTHEVKISQCLINRGLRWMVEVNLEGFALAVDYVDFISFFVEEGSNREVLVTPISLLNLVSLRRC